MLFDRCINWWLKALVFKFTKPTAWRIYSHLFESGLPQAAIKRNHSCIAANNWNTETVMKAAAAHGSDNPFIITQRKDGYCLFIYLEKLEYNCSITFTVNLYISKEYTFPLTIKISTSFTLSKVISTVFVVWVPYCQLLTSKVPPLIKPLISQSSSIICLHIHAFFSFAL